MHHAVGDATFVTQQTGGGGGKMNMKKIMAILAAVLFVASGFAAASAATASITEKKVTNTTPENEEKPTGIFSSTVGVIKVRKHVIDEPGFRLVRKTVPISIQSSRGTVMGNYVIVEIPKGQNSVKVGLTITPKPTLRQKIIYNQVDFSPKNPDVELRDGLLPNLLPFISDYQTITVSWP
ncbi:MAG: hypothetical protein V5A64_04085 [Candidatus Thermoplasmatota archaeon]